MSEIVSVDYLKMYADFANEDFLASAGVTGQEKSVVLKLLEQVDDVNPLYIPDLQLEGLVTESIKPYTALRALGDLKERRFITYGIAERVPSETPSVTHEAILYSGVVKQAREQGAFEEEEVEDQSAVSIMSYDYRRVAVFNLEYPVIYYCLQEEVDKESRGFGTGEMMGSYYASIKSGRLYDYLKKISKNSLLEFLHFMQSMFQQPFTEPEKKIEQNESKTDAQGDSGSGGLAPGVHPQGIGGEIPKKSFDDLSVETQTRVGEDGEGSNQSKA